MGVKDDNIDHNRIILGVLESLERDSKHTHRSIAAELGIALGLANAYIKRCINAGLVKVRTTPARRYSYFLTPRGFAEKSRLTAQYLSFSFSLFRQARAEYTELFREGRQRGWTGVALVGLSDLVEIAMICTAEVDIAIIGVIDATTKKQQHLGYPVFAAYDELPPNVSGLVVTDLRAPRKAFEAAVLHLGSERVLVPRLLGVSRGPSAPREAAR